MAFKGEIKVSRAARGNKRRVLVDAAKERVQNYHEYFIRRSGAWFRPGAHGYTGDLADAGLFLGKDAKGFLEAEGVSLVPVGSMHNEIQQGVGDALGRAARLAEFFNHY